MPSKLLFWVLFLFIISAAAAMAIENKGADMMSLSGGKQGSVPFPHHKHQDNLKDCQACHAVFPQEKGAIDKMKAEGNLKPKAVMNKQCIKCHRAEKKSGNPSGPLTCTTCHKR